MNCIDYKECNWDCEHCLNTPEFNDAIDDELKDYFESNEADSYLSSIESQEEKFIDTILCN